MKNAGLSSKTKKALRHLTKTATNFSVHQEAHFAAKEKQRQLRMLAARAQFERQKREEDANASTVEQDAASATDFEQK